MPSNILYRTELADYIKQALDQSPPEKWGGPSSTGYILGTGAPDSSDPNYITTVVNLDPYSDAINSKPTVFIIPGYIEFKGVDQRRRAGVQHSRIIYVTVALSVRLTGIDGGNDVCPKNVWEKWTWLRDEIDNFLSTFNYQTFTKPFTLEEIETSPPDEIKLDDRYYLEATVYGFAPGC